MSDFLGAPGAIPSLPELSFQYPAEWAHVSKIIQGRAATLKRLRFRLNRRFGDALLVPCLSALRVLELETSIGDPPYRLPDTFITLLSQIPNAMPRLEHAVICATVSVFVRRSRFDLLALGEPEGVNDVAWTHSGPLDLGSRAAAHCQLCFQDFPPFDLSEELWELRAAAYREFVRCMGELMPTVRERGGLSFSQTRVYLGPLSVKGSLGGPILEDLERV
ncbi:hypothetical protein DFH06DRAFT_1199760 [Mycena polygramma]|nr:hypothetical protein DFH06DRAFT_1199760 [Mycena polygramma]